MLYFAEPAGRIAFEKFAKRYMGLPPDDAVVSDALRSVETFFDIAERLLHHKDYMAGKDFTNRLEKTRNPDSMSEKRFPKR